MKKQNLLNLGYFLIAIISGVVLSGVLILLFTKLIISTI